MRAVVLDRFGDEGVMRIESVPAPKAGPLDIRIAVHATAVNRADLLQREGHYPPPPGASEILGLECAGEIIEVGADVRGCSRGNRVMALLPGGGYAEEVVVDHRSVMRLPDTLTFEQGGAIPETFLTAFLNIFMLAGARRGERILIHGGGSGVGTSAITLCKLAGLHVIVTAGSDEKCRRCLEHGADEAINYRAEDFAEKARDVDIILDHIGARYLEANLQTLGTGGRLVVIGSMGGERRAQLDVGQLLSRRQQIIGSTLRARPPEQKEWIVKAFNARFGEGLRVGQIRPVINSVFSLAEVQDAHRKMAGDHFGKIVLKVR